MENDLFFFVEKILGERFANEDIELQIIAFFRSFIFSTTFSKQNFIESGEGGGGLKQTMIVLRLGRDIKSACK